MQRFRQFVVGRLALLTLLAVLVSLAVESVYKFETTRNIGRLHFYVKPETVNGSATGYLWNQRDLVSKNSGVDGYEWIMQTQQMLADGGWRVRKENFDNAPGGRDVHWAAPFRWWLAALAWLDHMLTERSLPIAIEDVAPISGVLLAAVLIIGATFVAARRFGQVPAAIFAAGSIAMAPLYFAYFSGRADHHGIAALCAVMSLLFLLAGGAGWVRGTIPEGFGASDFEQWLPGDASARRWFFASAITGAIGMWVSAASLLPVIVECAVAAMASTWWYRRLPSNSAPIWRPEPKLWRVWGYSGGVACLVFYLIEYFPSNMGMRLEVNHPLYALAWAAMGELLCRVGRRLHNRDSKASSRDFAAIVASLFLAVLPLGIVLVAHGRVFQVADPFLLDLHRRYIDEFKPLTDYYVTLKPGEWVVALSPWILLATALVLWRTHWSRMPIPAQSFIVIGAVPVLATFALAVWQQRWMEIAAGLCLAWFTAAFSIMRKAGVFRWTPANLAWTSAALALAIAPGWISMVYSAINNGTNTINKSEAIQLVTRDIAHRLRARVGAMDATVLSGPTTTTWMNYWGGFRGLGTLYWENIGGLKTSAAIYAADSNDDARELIMKAGVTHLVLFSWDLFDDAYAQLHKGKSGAGVSETFIGGILREGRIPPWLRPVFFPVPTDNFMQGQSVGVFEVDFKQTPLEAENHLAQYCIDIGNLNKAQASVQSALRTDSNNLLSVATAIRLFFAAKQPTLMAEAASHMKLLMTQADTLAVDDRISVVIALGMAGDREEMTKQARASMALATPADLRRLSPGDKYAFVSLIQQVGIEDVRPALVPFVESLVTLDNRAHLLAEKATLERWAGRSAQAVALYRQALVAQPDSPALLNGLAWILATNPDATVRNGPEAVTLARRAVEIDGGAHTDVLDTLACALAETKQFQEAVDVESRAAKKAEQAKQQSLSDNYLLRMLLFKTGQPYRENAPQK